MKFKKPIEVQAGISDGDPTNPLGLSGYLLSSDGSNVNWVSPSGLSSETAEAIVQPIKANEALAKGDPLYIVGYQIGQDVNIVAKADSSLPAKMPVVGLADDDYASQAFGTMTAFGSFNGAFDTTGPGTESWTIGDIIFVKPGGGLTNIKPTGTDLIQNVAIVSRVNSQTGELEVIALGRTNDVPNLPEGRLFVGTSDNTSLTSDVVYIDEPNNRVGIGTTSPLGAIQIGDGAAASPSTNQIIVLSNTATTGGSSNLYLATGASGTSTIGVGSTQFSPTNTAGKIIYSDIVDTFSFNTNFSTKMVINGSGDVGIGETNPGAKLEVVGTTGVIIDSGSSSAAKLTLKGDGSPFGGGASIDVIGGSNDYLSYILNIKRSPSTLEASNSYFQYNAGWEWNGNQSNSRAQPYTSYSFRSQGSSQMVIYNNNLGIGVTTPSQKLHVNGNARVTGAYYDSSNSPGAANSVLISTISGTVWGARGPLGGGTTNYLARWTPDGNTLGIGVTYDNGTSVGIGTTSPGTYKLAVAGSTAIGENLEVSDGLGGDKTLSIDATVGTFQIGDIDGIGDEAYVEGDSSSIKIFTGGSETLVCDNNQRVGIGTNIPQAKLHVANGTLRTWTPTSGTSAIFESTVSNRNFLTLTAANQAELWFGDATTQAKGRIRYVISDGLLNLEDMEFWTNSTQQMIINFQGDVGIGTDAPNERMHVRGSGGVRLEVEATDSTVAALKLTNTAGSYGSFVNASGSLSVYDYNANDTRTTLLANGNFGIGTTDPTAKLHVVQSTAANGEAALHLIGPSSNPALTSSVLIIEQGDGKKITIDGNDIDVSSGDLFINDYSKEDVTFGGQIKVNGGGTPVGDSYFANGNVGVATTNPRTKLHVSGLTSDDDPALGSSTAPLFISNASDSYGLNVGVNNVGASWLQAQSNTSSTAYEMSLNPLGGNVGVGLINPGFKLDVNGEIHSSTYVSATAGLGVDSTTGTLGRGISLYSGPSLYPQYGLLFAQTVDLGTYGGVSGDWATYMTMSGTATRGWIWKAGPTNSTANNVASISGVGQLTLASTATATNFILSSDETLKDNIKEIDTKHVDVDWKNFELKSEPGIKRAGVIAQELEIKHPEFVRTADDGLKSVAYIDLLITKIAELEARLEKLEK